MARPIIKLTAEQAEEVESLAAVLNQEQIADCLEISVDTFQRILKRDEAVLRSYKKGKSKAIASVGANLIAQAKEGNVAASIFYLKTQAGWKETQTLDHKSSDGSMSPISLTDEQLLLIASE
jgi:DNA-binding CsgD family transcriptional regulator